MFSQLSDQQLIGLYIENNIQALEVLINRHKRKLFTSIYLLVKDKDVADDIFQDTFIKIIKTLQSGSYNEEGKFLPWACRIAHNLVIDYFREQKKLNLARDGEDYSIFDTIEIPEENIQDKILRDQLHSEIRDLINLLPQEQKEVLVMRHYADLSFKEIAEQTNVSINTALGRMRYALINLRKLVESKNIYIDIN